ncbi:helix-turn-helix transcriptional regulator [Dyella sp. C11]|uniref:helix-turn-helix transcriptional regulator n=1 Tax=Dyella sp. C11 TaxID=2126991 RepID=UPI000D657EC3|nr:helix-turn-helix transcriptional regulator [Dyella sp. C11]
MAQLALSGLLDRLYDMSPTAADWRPFLSAVGDAFRSHAVAFHSHDVLHQQGVIDKSVGVDTDLAVRFKNLAHEHPWYIHGGEQLFREGLADDKGLLPPRALYSSRFYSEVLKPLGIEHGMALLLRHDGLSQMTVLSINRQSKEGYFKPAERQQAQSLLPHLRTAYLLQQRLGWMETLARTFRASLDRLEDGVIILDRRGVIRFANTSAERLEARAIYQRSLDGRLSLPTRAQSNQLHAYVRTASIACPQPFSMRVHDPVGRWQASLKACPIDQVADAQWGEPDAGIMLFISETQTCVLSNHRAHWQELWGFTSAEACLAQRLAAGNSLQEAAEDSSVSLNTVRTHLRALFAKTNTRRQSDLVRVLILSRG